MLQAAALCWDNVYDDLYRDLFKRPRPPELELGLVLGPWVFGTASTEGGASVAKYLQFNPA